MSTRLAITLAIPVVGVVALLAGLALVAGQATTVSYAGTEYVGGAVVERAPGASPTAARVDGKQVWLVAERRLGPPERIWLQLADGRFQAYRRRT